MLSCHSTCGMCAYPCPLCELLHVRCEGDLAEVPQSDYLIAASVYIDVGEPLIKPFHGNLKVLAVTPLCVTFLN